MRKVIHQRKALDWIDASEIENPKTLILGSFNPYESIHKSVDYYYGRQSNHLWKTIANLLNYEENYFFDKQNGLERKRDTMQTNFCFYDVIDSIEVSSVDENILNRYIDNEIYRNFLDNKIWTSKTTYENVEIKLKRNYNPQVIKLLKNSSSIERVIHTMGKNRINRNKVNPAEKNLNGQGFNDYINKIKSICDEKRIVFDYESLSPSGYAIKTGKVTKEELGLWLSRSVIIP
jgi:G:T/U-mismatch repair DNA glycosylase